MTKARLALRTEQWLTIKDIAVESGWKVNWVRTCVHRHEMGRDIGRRGACLMIPKAEADKWIAANKKDKPRAFLTPLEPKAVCPAAKFHGRKP